MIKIFGGNEFSVLLGICSHREIKIRTLESLLGLHNCPNPKIHYKVLVGDALISRSRSLVATFFLREMHDDILMFIDDDIQISTLDATKLMWAVRDHKLDIVGGIYPTKSQDNPTMVMTPLEFGGGVDFGTEGGFMEVRHIGNGCMAIRREVLEKMRDNLPLCVHGERKYWPFFQHQKAQVDGVWLDLSEDYYFCEEARKLGFKVFADTRIKLGHEGSYLYSWDDVVETKQHLRKKRDSVSFGMENANNQIPSRNGERPETVKVAEGA